MQKAIFTIVSNNYLHYARTLLQSAAKHHPECDLFCVIVDKDDSYASSYATEFRVVRLVDLDLPDAPQFIFRYTILELNTAVKPWAFGRLFEIGYVDVLYIDPDIHLYGRMLEVFALLDKEADIVITPHLLAPMNDDKEPTELSIRLAGTYNFGFCALRNTTNTRQFITWWQSKLLFDCVVDQARGIFVDQSWIDLVPGMFPRVAILRHPGYNVAYWNLAQRHVRQVDGAWRVNDEPLIFFHFSGFNADYPESFSKHQNRFSFDNMGEEKALALEYAAVLIQNDYRILKLLPYGYSHFADGRTLIADLFRKTYRENRKLQTLLGDDPFARPEAQLWPLDDVRVGSLSPTYAMFAVWSARADVREFFPLMEEGSIARFYEWFATDGHQYFSQHVVDAHVELLAKSRSQPTVVRASGKGVIPRSRSVRQLYLTILGREVDRSGMQRYERRLQRPLGYVGVLLAMLLSPESRARPQWRSRAWRGLKILLDRKEETPATDIGAGEVPRKELIVGASGWSVLDADVVEQGCWVTPHATLPCFAGANDIISIEGTSYASFVARQPRQKKIQLAVSLDGHLIGKKLLDEDGPFLLELRIPAGVARGISILGFECRSYFVPKTIGLNDDVRQLSWRAARVLVGSTVVVDKARKPVILPLDRIAEADGVNIVGYIAAESGVGESARSFAKGCRAAEIAYNTIDVGYQIENRQSDVSALEGALGVTRHFRFTVLHVNADQTPRTIEAIGTAGRSDNVNIAYWHWEQPALPLAFLSSFNDVEEIWVPSAFVQQAVAQISPVPVFKVPHVIEFAIPQDASRAKFGLPENIFLVLIMYDFDSYQYRKNPQAAIEAFRAAFGRDGCSSAGLVIKTINGYRNIEGQRELIESLGSLANVFLIDDYMSRSDVYALQQVCDCFLSLHRAEGFGLGLAEMMYLGKPVVGTDWSGNTEFMNSGNSCPVRFTLQTLRDDLGVYESGQLWAEADIDHAAAALQALLEDDKYRTRIAEAAYSDMRTFYSASAIGSAYKKRLAMLTLRQ